LDVMTEDEEMSIIHVCDFFRSLHALVHMADICSKTLVEIDNLTLIDMWLQFNNLRLKKWISKTCLHML